MKLRPCEPESLVTSQVFAVATNSAKTTGRPLQSHSATLHGLPRRKRCKSCRSRKGDSLVVAVQNADDVFKHGKSGIYIPYRKNRPIGVARFTQIEVAAQSKVFNQDCCFGVGSAPSRPSS